VAMLVGAGLGFEREEEGKTAGLRTHMLVSMGAAVFVLVPLEMGFDLSALGRIIQGINEGIGFIGAGTILKLTDKEKIKGLTTAANIWLAAAAGMTIGLGWLWPAILIVLFAWAILVLVHRVEPWVRGSRPDRNQEGTGG